MKTTRTGLGRKAGHDLTLEARRWAGQVILDPAVPGRSSVTVDVDAGSLEAVEGTGGLKPLTDSDRADIKKTIRDKILKPGEHPSITFVSAEVAGTAESFTVTGDLTIMGTSRPLTIEAAVGGDGRVRGAGTVVQSAWGIKPYSALAGALRLADEVRVEFDLAPFA